MRKARKNKQISQMALYKSTGLDRTYISALERGVQKPSLRTVIRVANGIGISPNELVQATLNSPLYVVPTDDGIGCADSTSIS